MKNFWVLICDDFCFTIIAVCVHLEWVHFSDFFSWNKNISRNSPFQLAFGFSQERFLFSYSLIMRGSRQYLYFPSSETYALDPTPYQIPLKDPLTNCVLSFMNLFLWCYDESTWSFRKILVLWKIDKKMRQWQTHHVWHVADSRNRGEHKHPCWWQYGCLDWIELIVTPSDTPRKLLWLEVSL